MTGSIVRERKILGLDELAARVSRLRAGGKKVVLCHGVFDLLHVGHVRHLREAKRWGDVLVVTITPDDLVNKGPGRPTFPQDLRAEVIAALDDVDHVAINRWPTAAEAIQMLRPDVFAKGPDYVDAAKDLTGGISQEAEAARSVGGVVRFTSDISYSSSHLINRFFSPFGAEVNEFLKGFRSRRSASEVVGFIESLKSLRVVVVGETILDEYVYCDVMGKASKDPVLALRYGSDETYAGGAAAIANHLSTFCKEVELVSYLGDLRTHEEIIRRALRPNVRATFVRKRGAPTIVKRRFVERYLVTKLLEVYEIDDSPLDDDTETELNDLLRPAVARADVVIAADYGHGLIGPRTVRELVAGARFLAVNTQVNAANLGFHAISKYPSASYVCIHEGEMRLDRRDRSSEVSELMADLAERLDADTVIVTLGKRGLISYRPGEGFATCPAFSTRVVDLVGAGDAVFAVTSLCVANGVPQDATGFIGNLVGAQAVTIVGNSASVDRIQLLKAVEAMMK